MLRKSFFVIISLALLLFLIASYQLWLNNREVPKPSQERIAKSLVSSIGWLENNQDDILANENPMLWWMIKESAELNHHPTLTNLFAKYQARYLDGKPYKPWQHLFYRDATAALSSESLQAMLDYKLFLLYGLTCNQELGHTETIKQQLNINFCDKNHPFSPPCITHQLMGIRFMQRRSCGEPIYNDKLANELLERIVRQLTWDARVVDVYIQRVLMLADAGAGNRIKPIWLRRVLDAQQSDGGWSSFMAIIPLGNNFAIGSGHKFIDFGTEKSNFHATAQGVLVMSLLLSR